MAAELGRRLGLSPAPARVSAKRYSARTHWLLDEHRLASGEALIPGAGFMEIVRAAFDGDPDARPLEIRDVAFLSPFVVPDGEERELTFIYSAWGCPVKLFAKRVGDRTARVSGTPVIFPDDPAAVKLIAQLMKW